jgi:acetyl esterase/lipase
MARVKALATDIAMRLALLVVNVPAAFGAYRREVDIPYGADRKHRLDIYRPTGNAPTRPLVIFWHGGRWSSGDKVEYRFVGAALAELGYVVVLPNYRHYPEVRLRGFMEDAARALDWATEHARELGADPGRVFTMGHSSGAHLAALLTLNTSYFAAIGRSVPRITGLIGLSGPYDFLPLKEADVKDMFGPPEHYPASQPVNYVRADAPPALLIHGSKDHMVSPENSRSLAAALRACGVEATLALYPHVGHADTLAALSRPGRRRASTLADIAAFVDRARPQAALDAATAGVA